VWEGRGRKRQRLLAPPLLLRLLVESELVSDCAHIPPGVWLVCV